MKLLCLLLLTTLNAFAHAQLTTNTSGQSFGLAFMNITPDTREEGFVQIFCVSTNVSAIHIQSLTGINSFDILTTDVSQFYNGTYNYNDLKVVEQTQIGKTYVNRLGLILSSSNDVHVYGVKSDKGTTDGYRALPLTLQSTQFFIAAWQCVDTKTFDFFAAFQVISVLSDTCVEYYKIVNGTVYQLVSKIYFQDPYEVFLATASVGQDLTGYYVNSSKPISILAGHSCAFVPDNVYFCDHIVEQIPPVSELGKTHIVPPILGRDDSAGYYVRVVATQLDTTVTWESATTQAKGQVVITRGQFKEIKNPQAGQPMKVYCDKPCLVMQYNPGRQAAARNIIDKPTDPFMMNIAPVERFDIESGFATASFCDVRNSVTYKIDFSNFVSIVVSTDSINDILFDGQKMTMTTGWMSPGNWGYSVATFGVTHGAHVITRVPGSKARFGAYAYGHSQLDSSSGAYGYTAAFQVSGTLLNTLWTTSQEQLLQQTVQDQSKSCEQERIRSGSAVARFRSASNPQVVNYPFTLNVTVKTPPMSFGCREQFRLSLLRDLLALSRDINYRICNRTMCAGLTGTGGVPINASVPVTYTNKQVVFVAINTAELTDPVSFDVVASTGAITTINVVVPYTGVMDTTTETFALCRAEVRQFMRQFVNWPSGQRLVSDISGCPSITFDPPYEFIMRQTVCPVDRKSVV